MGNINGIACTRCLLAGRWEWELGLAQGTELRSMRACCETAKTIGQAFNPCVHFLDRLRWERSAHQQARWMWRRPTAQWARCATFSNPCLYCPAFEPGGTGASHNFSVLALQPPTAPCVVGLLVREQI